MYDKLSCRIRDRIEIEKHYSGRYGAPGMPRGERARATPEDVARQNHWRRCRDLRRTMELNFSPGDWHVVLTCRPGERPGKEDAPAVIREFRNRLRRAYQKQGWELKYIITCETGERGAVHWHMVVNSMHSEGCDTARLVRELWKRGRTYFSPLDDTGEYGKLAEYIVKEAKRRIDGGETAEKLSYIASRNLIRPAVARERIRAAGWRKKPRPPEGWELVPGTLVNGTNKYTGLPYQHYTIRRKEGQDTDADGQYLHRHVHTRSSPRGG